MPRTIAAAAWPDLLQRGWTVYMPGVSGESTLLTAALQARPERAAGVTFTGVWLPGLNRLDYAGLDPAAAGEAFFLSRTVAASLAAGRLRYRPLSYVETYRYLAARATAIDLAVLQVSPPDGAGRVSLGAANDFTPAVLAGARRRLAHINPTMPRTRGAATIALADLDWIVAAEAPLLADATGSDAAWQEIARLVATIVPDGATIEVGIGQVQQALAGLVGHRRLALHSGAIMTPVLDLVRSGAIDPRPGAIVAGVAIGQPDLYAFIADSPQVAMAPVGYTHDIGVLGRIDRFHALNAVIEVDLFGQANAETLDGRPVSSAGGIVDFMRGARRSPGGRAIVALPATAKGGRTSRIVAALAAGTPVSVARADMDLVVTEFGIADLRDADVEARAAALIGIAAPPFRDALAAAWRNHGSGGRDGGRVS